MRSPHDRCQINICQAALSSHPDKVAEDERAEAEIKFKSVGKAYEILSDDDKRHLYDKHGMSAFAGHKVSGMDAGVDLDEMLAQMFGMSGMGQGASPGFTGHSGSRRPKKGADEEHNYEISLEDLYKGKTTKFASKKNVICTRCKGTGGKETSKPKQCASCQGKGTIKLRLGPSSLG